MKSFVSTSMALASIGGAVAQSGSVTGTQGANCNGFKISLQNVQSAADAALKLIKAGQQVGENKYPHEEDDREGFKFLPDCHKPYYEFPIMKDGSAYDGGEPGADRVIIGTVCGPKAVFGGVVTHQGADGDDFVQCQLDGKNSTVLYGVHYGLPVPNVPWPEQ